MSIFFFLSSEMHLDLNLYLNHCILSVLNALMCLRADDVCQKRPGWAFLPIRQLADTHLQFCGFSHYFYSFFNVHGRN